MTSAQLFKIMGLDAANWMNQSYKSYAEEGYIKNIVAYHCITRIAQSVADIPYYVQVNGKEVQKHPALQLLKRPNIKQSYKTWMQQVVMYRLISGNSYLLANTVSTGRIMEFTNLRPDRVCIRTNSQNEPIAYDYTINGSLYSYLIDPITYDSEVLHIKEPHPLCDLYGLSPIQAAAMTIDQHNESGEWNKKLLENSARPPGILAMKDKGDNAPPLKADQLQQISEMLNDKFAGFRNAGKVPVINFDMEWRSMGMSPTDMDWINGKNTSARDICLAFGYPSLLLGMPEGATFSNVAEAKLALYEETVIPLLQSILSEIAYYLSLHDKQEIEIVPNLDGVTALQPRRQIARQNARDDMLAGLISPNEARLEIGYDPVQGGDDLLVPAGKLPLNFDVSTMDKSSYQFWLKANGFSDDYIEKMAALAFEYE